MSGEISSPYIIGRIPTAACLALLATKKECLNPLFIQDMHMIFSCYDSLAQSKKLSHVVESCCVQTFCITSMVECLLSVFILK